MRPKDKGRSGVVSVRVTHAEQRDLGKRAAASGMSISRYVRSVLFRNREQLPAEAAATTTGNLPQFLACGGISRSGVQPQGQGLRLVSPLGEGIDLEGATITVCASAA